MEAVRRRGLRRRLVTVASVQGRTATVLVEGSRLSAGALQVELEIPSDARWISAIFGPDPRPALKAIAATASAFLRVKSEACSLMTRLQQNPRSVLLEYFEEVPEAVNPIGLITAESQSRVSSGMERLREDADDLSTEFPDELRSRLYASLYAVCLFQDSSLRGDQGLRSTGLRLLAEASSIECPALETLEAMGTEEACLELLRRSMEGLATSRARGADASDPDTQPRATPT